MAALLKGHGGRLMRITEERRGESCGRGGRRR
jgi:hypothetical protein